MSEKKDRIMTPDITKGLIITAIIFCHLFMSNTGGSSGSSPLYINLGFMGLMAFFVISGYFFRPGRSYKDNVVKRLAALGIPLLGCFFVLTTLMWAILVATGQVSGTGDLVDALGRIIGSEHVFDSYGPSTYYPKSGICTGYYFLQVMLVAFVIFYAVANYVLDDVRRFVVATVLLILATALIREFVPIELPFFAQLAPLAAAMMLFGAFLGRRDVLRWLEGDAWKTGRYWAMLVASLVVAVGVMVFFPTGIDFYYTYFGAYGGWSAFPFFVIAISLSYAVFVITSWIARVPGLSTVVSVIGSHTLAILLLHGFIIKLFAVAFGYDIPTASWFPVMTLAQRLILAVVCIVAGCVGGIYGSRFLGKVFESLAKKA